MESSSAPDQRTALLVDEHPLWLDAVAGVLTRIGVEVVGTTTSTEHAVALLGEHAPSLVVIGLDGRGGGGDGLQLLERVRELRPETRTVVLSSIRDEGRIEAALAAGAVAYVVKTVHADDLAYAMRQAFSHSVFVSATRPAAGPRTAPAGTEAPAVTRREAEILRLVAEGHSNADVARMLWIAEQTVKFHLSNVYRKLNVSNRTEASRWAQLHGLLGSRGGAERLTPELGVA